MHSPSRRGDGHLWMIALAISLLANTGLLVIVGLAALESAILRKNLAEAAPPPPPPETVATIFAEIAENRSNLERVAPSKKNFARTSADQAAPPEDKNSAFIGERDTRATSDRTPDLAAPPLPSQAGIEGKDREIETTQSSYRDGKLSTDANPTPVAAPAPATPASVTPAPPEPAATAETKPTDKPDIPGTDSERSTPPVREKLLDGPNPVDVPVPRETAKQQNIKPTPEKRPPEPTPAPPESVKPADEPKIAEPPKPPPPPDPAFSGFQRKTAVLGSISRTGRSALDVVDTPLGRYEATISRAVELEFQRNCVRHRDFITPGFLTVRFFVEPGGKVRSVSFDGDMSTGEIQKGFTLNSIRNAEIPPMPQSLRKEYNKEPLELLFRFHF